jgi:hypothetical protein
VLSSFCADFFPVADTGKCHLYRSVSRVNDEWFGDEERVRELVGLVHPADPETARSRRKVVYYAGLPAFAYFRPLLWILGSLSLCGRGLRCLYIWVLQPWFHAISKALPRPVVMLPWYDTTTLEIVYTTVRLR